MENNRHIMSNYNYVYEFIACLTTSLEKENIIKGNKTPPKRKRD